MTENTKSMIMISVQGLFAFALMAAAVLLAGCGKPPELQTVAIAEKLEDLKVKPVKPVECTVKDRKPFPQIESKPDGTAEDKELKHAYLKAKTRHETNMQKTDFCEKWIDRSLAPEAAPAPAAPKGKSTS